jgi:hypothetical protein
MLGQAAAWPRGLGDTLIEAFKARGGFTFHALKG